MSTFALRTNDGDIWPDQTVLFDGYHVAERLLEGVRFVLVAKDGELTFSHIYEEDRSYVEDFASAKRIAEWGDEAVKFMTDYDTDGLATDHETDLHWGDA